MRKIIIRSLALLLTMAILISATYINVLALDFVSGANSASELYKASEYYQKLTSISLTGDNRTDLIAVALSQLGYTEGDEKNDFSGSADGSQNYTEYNYNMGSFGSGYGGVDYPWCASFASFCLLQAGVHNQKSVSDWCRKHEGDATYIYREVSCNKWATQLRSCGYFKNSIQFGGNYIPLPGDLIFFTENGIRESHIGIVLYCDGKRVYTVEGNTNQASGMESNGDGVYAKDYALESSYIRGYGVLPYTVNNSVCPIDYSGERATTGTYIATVAKYVYPTEAASTYDYIMPKNTTFTVTELTDSGRLKVLYTTSEGTFEGFVKNNSDRVIQISGEINEGRYSQIESIWKYESSKIDNYSINGEPLADKESELNLVVGDLLTVGGNITIGREVASFGYYVDGKYEMLLLDESAAKSKEGDTVSFEISLDTATLFAGKHTATIVVNLKDGTLAELCEVDFITRHKNQTTPQAPKIEVFDETSITLFATEGYEYRLFEGEWQKSNVFSGLTATENSPLVFYQRRARTDTMLESNISAPLTVDLYSLLAANELTSLKVDGAELCPEFDPHLTEYQVTIPYSLEITDPIFTAKDGARVSIAKTLDADGEPYEIKISVECEYGRVRDYLITVTRESEPEESQSEIVTEPQTTEADTTETSDMPITQESVEATTVQIAQLTSCAANANTAILIILALGAVSAMITKRKEE